MKLKNSKKGTKVREEIAKNKKKIRKKDRPINERESKLPDYL